MGMFGKMIYIVRSYLLLDDYGGVRIDEESVFLTLKEAKKHLETYFEEDISDDDLQIFRCEIVEFLSGEDYIKKWIYNLRGDILEILSQDDNEYEQNRVIDVSKFFIGDIVYILPRIFNKYSPSVRGAYGVVVESPFGDSDKKELISARLQSSNEYVIYYINENGLLDHKHAIDSVLVKPKTEMPIEFSFLVLLSKYFKNEIKFPDNLIERLNSEDVFLKNAKRLDFQTLEIKEPI